MIVALYSKNPTAREFKIVSEVVLELKQHKVEIMMHKNLKQKSHVIYNQDITYFSFHEELIKSTPDALISFGGDGTILDTLSLIQNLGIPVLGINTGRLGFLSNISSENFAHAVHAILNKEYEIEQRSLLELVSDGNLFHGHCWALNDFSIHKRDTSSMITIEAFINGQLLNSYWADGLLVATPTGSTAYSLSCGGPIVFPDSSVFVVTPVAPHNLNVRPIVIADSGELSFKIKGRGTNFLVALDSRNEIARYTNEIKIRKASFKMKFITLKHQSFISTLQDKLNWGKDNRNVLH